jgi:hypothetical protein
MTKWTGDDAKKVLAEIERIAVLQAEINSAEINAADLSPPDPCKNLLTAARAVVENTGETVHGGVHRYYETPVEEIAALRMAVEAAEGSSCQ